MTNITKFSYKYFETYSTISISFDGSNLQKLNEQWFYNAQYPTNEDKSRTVLCQRQALSATVSARNISMFDPKIIETNGFYSVERESRFESKASQSIEQRM